jgi:hypothetical protein
MRKNIHLKFISSVLVTVLLTVTILCVHENAYATHHHATIVKITSHTQITVPADCPASPLEQHKECDGCDTCAHCACHAPLTIQPSDSATIRQFWSCKRATPSTHYPKYSFPNSSLLKYWPKRFNGGGLP